MYRIVAVNVRSGGTLSKVDLIANRVMAHRPQIVVISEYRDTPAGAALRAAFARKGLGHTAYTTGFRGNGVCILAKTEFGASYNPAGLDDDQYPNAIIESVFPKKKLHVLGVYLPGQDRKRPHMEWLIQTARLYNELGRRAICIGDFNSGRNETDIELNVGRRVPVDEFSTADLYARLEQEWTEAWLAHNPACLEFSWYPFRADGRRMRNGWRLDKAFVSNALAPRVREARYDHSFRTLALTDHSALVITLT